MKQLRNLILVCCLSNLLFGCSAINLLFDDQKVFVNERNSEVGRKLSEVLKSDKYYAYWEGNQGTAFGKQYDVVSIDSDHSEYVFDLGTCRWSLIVRKSSGVVSSWRFVQQTSDCAYKRFYEGAF